MTAIALDTVLALAGRTMSSAMLKRRGIHVRERGSSAKCDNCYDFEVEVSCWRKFFWILANPRLRLGEAYQEGALTVVKGDISELISALFDLEDRWNLSLLGKIHKRISRHRFVRNQKYGAVTSKHNVHLHYDVGNDFYKSFLDSGMNYSCGFFEGGITNLEDAQQTKIARSMERCVTEKSLDFLEIGCGWGSLAEAAHNDHGLNVTAISLSEEQIEYCKHNKNQNIDFRLEDYRTHAENNNGKYDSIASIGMFEHVGIGQFDEYFQAISKLLKKNGRAVVHTIIRPELGVTNPWINRYVFPGGYIASETEIESAVAASKDLELVATHKNHGQHYMKTLKYWRDNLNLNKDLLPSKYDERLIRTFEFYLAGSEAAFRSRGMCVVQFEIAKV